MKNKKISPSALLGVRTGAWRRKLGPHIHDVVINSSYHKASPDILHHPPSSPPIAMNVTGACVSKPLYPQTERPDLISLIESSDISRFTQRFGNFTPRTTFSFNRDVSFYLGHMQQVSPQIQLLLKKMIDVVIEVRDARAPFTSSNFFVMDNVPPHIQRIVVLTKVDLIESQFTKAVKKIIETSGYTCFLVHGDDRVAARHIREWIMKNSFEKWRSVGRTALVLGLPNVGKSSLINAMRSEAVLLGESLGALGRLCFTKKVYKEKTTLVTGIPTTTKHILPLKITHSPKLYVYDTPGIMLPRMKDKEIIVKLACLSVIPTHIIGAQYVADYLLYRLNKAKCFHYVDEFFLDTPTNDISTLGRKIWNILQVEGRSSAVQTTEIYDTFINRFNKGRLGKISLDHIPLLSELSFRGDINISEPPGPWGPSQYPDPIRGLS